jgi:hypothetical protein
MQLMSVAAGGSTGSAGSFVYRGADGDFGAGATLTSTNFAIGAAAADREVFVSVWGLGFTPRTISSVTIGGVSATLVAGPTGSLGNRRNLYRATVPTGTSATIVVSFSGSYANSGLDVWTASGFGTITTFSNNFVNNSNLTQDVTINTPSNGFSIISGFRYRGSAITITNSGSLAFTTDRYFADGQTAWIEGSVNPTSAVTGQVYTITYSAAAFSGGNTVFLAASFSF